MSIIKMLRHSNWVAINKDLVKLVGCNSAYLLGYLADKQQYFAARNEVRPDGFFFATAADVEQDLGLTTREQDSAIKRLALANFVETSVKGIPAKRYFRFSETSEQALQNALLGEQNGKTSFDKSAKLYSTNEQNSVQQKRETIYKEHTNISNIKKGISGEFHSPIAPQKASDEKADFSEWLAQNNFMRLSKTLFFLEKEKSCAKKEKMGEAAYLATLGAIDRYLCEKPRYLDGKKDFARVFDNFATSPELIAAKSELNRVFSSKFDTDYITDGKAIETALNGIITKLKALPSDTPIIAKIKGFFDAIATLPKFDNPMAWKPAFINSDFSEIIALLKNNKAQPSRGETYKERDARLAQEKEAETNRRIYERTEYNAQKDFILQYLDRKQPLTDEMKTWQPYIDMQNDEAF